MSFVCGGVDPWLTVGNLHGALGQQTLKGLKSLILPLYLIAMLPLRDFSKSSVRQVVPGAFSWLLSLPTFACQIPSNLIDSASTELNSRIDANKTFSLCFINVAIFYSIDSIRMQFASFRSGGFPGLICGHSTGRFAAANDRFHSGSRIHWPWCFHCFTGDLCRHQAWIVWTIMRRSDAHLPSSVVSADSGESYLKVQLTHSEHCWRNFAGCFLLCWLLGLVLHVD